MFRFCQRMMHGIRSYSSLLQDVGVCRQGEFFCISASVVPTCQRGERTKQQEALCLFGKPTWYWCLSEGLDPRLPHRADYHSYTNVNHKPKESKQWAEPALERIQARNKRPRSYLLVLACMIFFFFFPAFLSWKFNCNTLGFDPWFTCLFSSLEILPQYLDTVDKISIHLWI